MKQKLIFLITLLLFGLFLISVQAYHDDDNDDSDDNSDELRYDLDEYEDDNYDRYKEDYHPRLRPYSIAGTQPLKIFIGDKEGVRIAIPEFIPKDSYKKDNFVPRVYSDSYFNEPFTKYKGSSIAVRYVQPKESITIQKTTLIEIRLI